MFKFINDIVDSYDISPTISEPLKSELQRAVMDKIEYNSSEASKMLLVKELEIRNLRRKNAKRR